MRGRERPQRDPGLFEVDVRGQWQPHALVAHEILGVGAECLVTGDRDVARQIAEAARGLDRVGIFRMRHTDHAIPRLMARHRAADGDDVSRRLAAELLRQREGRPARDLVACEIAGTVLHVPSRY